MKCILLVAGYATRLYPLTIDTPKALLNIGGHPILDYILYQVNTIDEIDEIYVISNDRFYQHFLAWSKAVKTEKQIFVVNDNTTDDSNKLGAIGDMQFVIDKFNINDDLLVLAGDNLFTFDLIDFYKDFKNSGFDSICAHHIEEQHQLQRMAVALLDENDCVTDLEEKPQNPKSNIGVEAFYLYNQSTVPLIKQYLEQGNNPDSPGNFPSWLYKQKSVKAFRFKGICIDIGTKENFKYVNDNFDNLFSRGENPLVIKQK